MIVYDPLIFPSSGVFMAHHSIEIGLLSCLRFLCTTVNHSGVEAMYSISFGRSPTLIISLCIACDLPAQRLGLLIPLVEFLSDMVNHD